MDSNTHSPRRPPRRRDGLAALAEAVDELAGEDLDGLSDSIRAQRVLVLRRLLDRLDGQWLKELAGVDGHGAAGADQDSPAPSTASWLRHRLRMGATAAADCVRTARALYRGPLSATANALTGGEVSVAHARVLAQGTHDLPAHVAAEAEPVLLEAARRLDPPRLRRVLGHLRQVADPDGADQDSERQQQRRWLWLAPTWEGMVAVQGLLDPEAGHTVLAALEPLARPAGADDARSGGQRRADALCELARRSLEAGRLPRTGGVRPQLTVTVDLDRLLGRHGGLDGEAGWAGPLGAEACRRLACDAAVTRVLVRRHPTSHPGNHPGAHDHPGTHLGTPDHPGDHHGHDASDHKALGVRDGREAGGHCGDPCGHGSLEAQLRAAMALLPPVLGGAPSQPLDVGRATRVVTPAQRRALAVRDGGCVVPDCDRPLAWCEAHHLIPWLDGGPTDLANLALVCRAHHRAVHEGGWRLARGPDGSFTATGPHRAHRTTRRHRHPTAA
jgi:Domain of unknown function (DUF222)/HNH endonuclease